MKQLQFSLQKALDKTKKFHVDIIANNQHEKKLRTENIILEKFKKAYYKNIVVVKKNFETLEIKNYFKVSSYKKVCQGMTELTKKAKIMERDRLKSEG